MNAADCVDRCTPIGTPVMIFRNGKIFITRTESMPRRVFGPRGWRVDLEGLSPNGIRCSEVFILPDGRLRDVMEAWAKELEQSKPTGQGGVGPFIAAELRHRMTSQPI